MIKVGIVGGTGYTDVELLRLSTQHPQARTEVITSRSETGMKVTDMYPSLRGHYDDLQLSVSDVQHLSAYDVVFFAMPHGVAHVLAGELLGAGARAIDLSADSRLVDAEEWARWYGQSYDAPALLGEAVYDLPEVNCEKIRQARLIAVSGCYPIATQLDLIPLLEASLADASRLIAGCKSGASGVGRGAKVGSLFYEAGENMMAYAVKGYQHLPETSQGLRRASGGEVGLTFVLYLTSMIHGIHTTLYTHITGRSVDFQALFEKHYADEPFVDVMPAGSHPETRSVRGVNVCRIATHRPQSGDPVVVLSVINNLVKGTSGQTLQDMNILFGLGERLGLSHAVLLP